MDHSVEHKAADVDPNITLQQHEANSMQRAARIEHSIKHLKENKMTDGTSNVFHHGLGGSGAGVGAAMGGGLGAGLLGGILGGAVLNNGGLFGNRGHGGGDWGGGWRSAGDAPLSVDMAATQTMGLSNAIAGVGQNVTMGNQMLTNAINSGFGQAATNELQQTIMLQQGLFAVNQNVSSQGCQTREAVATDGNATRALITQLNTDNLNRLLTVADLDRRDEANRFRSREVEVNVSQTVNQAQAQAQAQQQQQQQVVLLNHLCGVVAGLQNAVATNSNLIVGNTGAVATGPQTANPVNVKT